ncbi:MAG: B12-binding domain-containing radical SAM protein, partial [Candidatus Hydrogenedens sp.]
MVPIILSTITARYSHSAFGLRYLHANLGKWKEQSQIKEFHLKQSPLFIAESILQDKPKIVGIGVYIWNVREITEVVQIIKKVSPQTTIIIGGPEVSYEYEDMTIFKEADYLICGEAEHIFPQLVKIIMSGQLPPRKVWEGTITDVNSLFLPYEEYTYEDIAHRIIYVESSRGCPFHCEFCLSAIKPGVRFFDRVQFLNEMEKLIQRGAKNFTFVDRTFNIREEHALEILRFFLKHIKEGMRI